MLRTGKSLTKLRMAAVGVLTTASIGIGSTSQVSATAVPLPISIVEQRSGHVTGVTFDNHTGQNLASGQTGYPANVADSVTVSFDGVTKNDGNPAPTDVAVGAAGFFATFCGNFTDTGVPAQDHALTVADVNSIQGIAANCGPLIPATSSVGPSPTGPTITATLPLTPRAPVAAVAATPDTGTHGAPAILAGSISPAISATLDDPPADIAATLFTPFIAQGSIHAATPAVAAVPPADIPSVPDTFVAGTPAVAAAPGTQCVVTSSVIPCLIIVASTDQTVALALPAVNVASVSVLGRVGLYNPLTGNGVCNPSSLTAAPSTCPAARISTPTEPYPFTFAGAGFIPNSNSAELIALMQIGTGVPLVGDNFSTITEKVCPGAADVGCLGGVADADQANPTRIDASGNFVGTLSIASSGGIAPGDQFLQVTSVHFVFTGGICGAGYTAVALGVCSTTQTQYAALRVLGTPTDPTFTPGSGAPGTIGGLSGSDYEPRAFVTIQRRDLAGQPFGPALTTVTDGVGNLSFTFAAAALDLPVTDVVINVVDAAFGATTYTSAPVVINRQAAIAFCLAASTCNAGQILTAAVSTRNVELLTGDAVVNIPSLDLSTIDVQDPLTWYPVSPPATINQVIINDMRGANTGFVVTGSAADLVGAKAATNRIPSADVFVALNSIFCDKYLGAADGSQPVGNLSVGLTADPHSNIAGASPLTDGTQEFCMLTPDAAGQAGGMFKLNAALQVAGRPITAVDDYTGLLVITITGN